MIADLVDGTRQTYHGTAEGIRDRVFGSNGVLETTCGGQVLIRGERFYRRGDADGVAAVVDALERLAPKAEKAGGVFHRQEVDQWTRSKSHRPSADPSRSSPPSRRP